MKAITWHTEKRKVKDLTPWEGNPRQMPKGMFEQLKASIKRFNYAAPVIINTDGTVIAGEQRVRALTELGREDEEIEVRVPDRKLSDKELSELNIRDNKNSGGWDTVKLFQNFEEKDLATWGFGKGALSFYTRIAQENDGMPELEEKATEVDLDVKVKSGDIFDLNVHRLMCGDSTIKKDVDALLDGYKFDLLITSPPYNMDGGQAMYKGYKDNKHNSDYITFNLNVLVNFKRYLDKNGFVIWNMSYNRNSGASFLELFYHIIKESGLKFLECVVWDKGHGMPLKDQLTRQYESLLVTNDSLENIHFTEYIGIFGKKLIPFIKDTNKGITNYWRIDSAGSQTEHIMAAFPEKLIKKALGITTVEGEIVADCFGGTGTTLIVCEAMHRKCFTMELDPEACRQIILRYTRLCKMNNTPLKLLKNGKAT